MKICTHSWHFWKALNEQDVNGGDFVIFRFNVWEK